MLAADCICFCLFAFTPLAENIWTSGPVVCQNRPNTWPRAEKGREQMTKRNQTRQGGAPRLNGRNATAKTTVVVQNPGKSNQKDGNPSMEPKGKVSTKVISVSKRFMEKVSRYFAPTL